MLSIVLSCSSEHVKKRDSALQKLLDNVDMSLGIYLQCFAKQMVSENSKLRSFFFA
jgi:hypothetical protein